MRRNKHDFKVGDYVWWGNQVFRVTETPNDAHLIRIQLNGSRHTPFWVTASYCLPLSRDEAVEVALGGIPEMKKPRTHKWT